jgi:hypothetical protein
MDGEEIEIIPVTQEDGIHAITFTFKDDWETNHRGCNGFNMFVALFVVESEIH